MQKNNLDFAKQNLTKLDEIWDIVKKKSDLTKNNINKNYNI